MKDDISDIILGKVFSAAAITSEFGRPSRTFRSVCQSCKLTPEATLPHRSAKLFSLRQTFDFKQKNYLVRIVQVGSQMLFFQPGSLRAGE